MNPELDMGQVEGGFVMGLGYFLQEKMVYDGNTGEAMNSGTWVRKMNATNECKISSLVISYYSHVRIY